MIKTILLVDESKSVLDILENEITSELDVRILKATNFKEAFKYIQQEEIIHVAILDLNLPDTQNGEIVDEAIRKDIPSIVLSAAINDKLKKTVLKKDIIDYVIKDSIRSTKNIFNLVDRALKNYDTHVMVVEDSPVQLKLAVAQLEKMKLKVSTATNGIEALDLIDKGDIDYSLILTDYNMPDMNGMDLTFKLRESFDKDKLGIIVLSANTAPNISTSFIKIGANDFIQKPYTYVEFKTRVNSNLALIDLFKNKSERELLLHEQDKKAQLNEMISDIAHHWRQPLSSIAISASGIKLNIELGMLDEEELVSTMDRIEESTQFLSKTIDTFKRFIEDEGDFQKINISESVNNILTMIEMVFLESNIKLINNINLEDNFIVNIMPLEFAQVMMNILNNANDALIKQEIENKIVEVSVFKKDNFAVITISDNAGGIENAIISKVFNPYFTTKHQAQSTGLGLHMANKIITDSFNGKIYVENIDQGAKFTIELPLS